MSTLQPLQPLSAFLLSLATITACSPRVASLPNPATRSVASIEIQRATPDSIWQVTWHLPATARELRFERPASGFRRDVFSVVTPGYTMERDGNIEVLRASGTPASEITIRFPAFTRILDKEYEFFLAFTDGGVGIYTGHLVVHPVYSDSTFNCDSCLIRSFRIVPPKGNGVVIRGKRFLTATEWNDVNGKGTYVYVGPATPLETADMISVIDPGLPQWIVARTRDALPQLFKFYRERFGLQLPVRPTVLFAYGGDKSNGLSSGGGTLPGLVQLGVDGNGWNTESRSGLLQLFRFLAHESTHLWNGEVAFFKTEQDSWMHEGGADAIAERTLLQLGLIDEDGFLGYQTTALNDCLIGIGNDGIRKAATRSSQLYYSCGDVVALLTESAIKNGGRNRDLFDFWRALFTRAIARDSTYAADDYFAVLADLTAPPDAIRDIRAFVEGVDRKAIPAMLTSRGISLVPVDTPPESYGQTLSRRGLFLLLADICTGRYGFRVQRSGMLLDSGAKCEGLPPGATVKAIGGHDMLRAGHLAWDYMHERCGSATPLGITIEVQRDGQPVVQETNAACKRPIAERGSYFRITSRPH